MKISKQDYNQIALINECLEEVKGYFYLIEMNLILLEMEYEYDTLLQYDDFSHYHSDLNEHTKH